MPSKPSKKSVWEEKILTEEEAEELADDLRRRVHSGQPIKNGKDDIEIMVAGLGDSRGLLRRTFAEYLGKLGTSALPALHWALLDHSEVTVRRAAAKTLKLVGDPSSLPYLLKAFTTDPDPVVKGSAMGAIAIFGERAIKPLEEILTDPKSSSMQCGLAAWGLAFVGAKAPQAIREAAKSNNKKLRSAAIGALGEQIQSLKDIEAENLVIKALNDPEKEVRAEAAILIGKIDKRHWAVPLLLKKIADQEAVVRKSAALSLMRLKAFEAIEQLQNRKVEENDSSVKKIISLAINQLIKQSTDNYN